MHTGKIAQGLVAAAQQQAAGKDRFTGDETVEAIHGQTLSLQLGDSQPPLAALGRDTLATGTTQHRQTLALAQPKVIAHQLQRRALAVAALEKPG